MKFDEELFGKKFGGSGDKFGKKYSDATTCPTNSHKLDCFDDSDDEDDDAFVISDEDADDLSQAEPVGPPPGLEPPLAPPGNFAIREPLAAVQAPPALERLHVTFSCQDEVYGKSDSDGATSSTASCADEASDEGSVVELEDDSPLSKGGVSVPVAPPPGLAPPGNFKEEDCGFCAEQPATVNLASASVGSLLHASGQCRPCAWYWKQGGCKNGSACRHCHMCPEGSVKALKRGKVALLKAGISPVVLPALRTTPFMMRG